MHTIDVARNYIDGWNAHDAVAINAVFAEGGTYEDPATGGPLTGEAIGANAQELFDALPDLHFDVVAIGESAPGRVTLEWLMKGTNSGPFAGLPPSGRTIALPGVDVIRIEGDKIRSVHGYFDRQVFSEQLGLQVITQPHEIGPFKFGDSVFVDLGRRTKPGAFSITSIELNSEDERAELRQRSQQVLIELTQMPGVISSFAGGMGKRGFTVTAWEDAESPRQLTRGGEHAEAMRRFFEGGFARSAVTMVWRPERINTMWVRCEACRRMVAGNDGGTCECGAPLPDHGPYW